MSKTENGKKSLEGGLIVSDITIPSLIFSSRIFSHPRRIIAVKDPDIINTITFESATEQQLREDTPEQFNARIRKRIEDYIKDSTIEPENIQTEFTTYRDVMAHYTTQYNLPILSQEEYRSLLKQTGR